MVVLNHFYKLNFFFVNFFTNSHFVLVLLLYSYFRGMCAFAIHQGIA